MEVPTRAVRMILARSPLQWCPFIKFRPARTRTRNFLRQNCAHGHVCDTRQKWKCLNACMPRTRRDLDKNLQITRVWTLSGHSCLAKLIPNRSETRFSLPSGFQQLLAAAGPTTDALPKRCPTPIYEVGPVRTCFYRCAPHIRIQNIQCF